MADNKKIQQTISRCRKRYTCAQIGPKNADIDKTDKNIKSIN